MAATTEAETHERSDDTPDDDSTPAAAPETGAGRRRLRLPGGVRRALALVVAAHPRQLVVTAGAVALAAFVGGRPMSEVGLVALTVALGQAILGWHNDIVDRQVDTAAGRTDKPLATGVLEPGTVWFAIATATLALVPVAVANGLVAAAAYVVGLGIALVGNLVLRGGVLSWLPWALSFATYPVFLSYGGLGGQHQGEPPVVEMVALAALLGVCVHVLRALPGLVQDNRDGRRHLPLRVAVRTGATRLLLLASVATAAVLAGIAITAATVGLTR
ncbi:4-hydroxybenzoate polyprenyltransferase [Nocardioides zeae]|uniref:4-hydroxybenzoate polyprenyltransferase n=2 Tax=Nocardioides zeae TaxID=1457234 RepID=A0ACC6ICI4_9ACTN|nr:UbiA family prenyltransferase [Nocardioides zeae]MDQ1104847.1 4-hydroxybenzoate polyprenyltransferase [Nocardioides zeae]MDR6175442.1 4-hydroxybenzoate polyprenyltransferase [Nocardioides zeae]MDR6208374.1 4-hydroxybenzoate polyprenyltransferase [Nocardioides zeae]